MDWELRRVIGTWSLMIFFGMHLLIGLCQAAYSFGDAATCDGAESYLCGTPLIGLVDVMRETPSFFTDQRGAHSRQHHLKSVGNVLIRLRHPIRWQRHT